MKGVPRETVAAYMEPAPFRAVAERDGNTEASAPTSIASLIASPTLPAAQTPAGNL